MLKKILLLSLLLAPAAALAQGALNTPGPGTTQSGSNVIVGYHCAADTATSFHAIIDGITRIDLIFPFDRAATMGLCGHTLTGISVQYFWAKIPAGQHEIIVYRDDVEFDRAQFETVRLAPGFITPTTPDVVVVENFPNPGDRVGLCWKESLQDFGICSYTELSGDFNRAQTERLRGTWQFNYMIGSSDFSQTYTLNSALQPGGEGFEDDWNIFGTDSFGNPDVIATYNSSSDTWFLVDLGFSTIHRIYVFDLDADDNAAGCLHLIIEGFDSLSTCFPMTGDKIAAKSVSLPYGDERLDEQKELDAMQSDMPGKTKPEPQFMRFYETMLDMVR